MPRDTYYVAPSVEPGSSISWSDLHESTPVTVYEDGEPYFPGSSLCHQVRVEYDGKKFTPIPYCTFGDYDNSTAVERSNLRVMREQFRELVHVTGSHGSQMLGFLGELDEQSTELREAIDSLESYPILDESDESELEIEMENEAWVSYGRYDFARELCELFDELDPGFDHKHDEDELDERVKSAHIASVFHPSYAWQDIADVWRDGCEAYNINGGPGFTIEGGGGVHFYTEQWIRDALQDPQEHNYGGGHVSRREFEMREKLIKLAHLTRSVEMVRALETFEVLARIGAAFALIFDDSTLRFALMDLDRRVSTSESTYDGERFTLIELN